MMNKIFLILIFWGIQCFGTGFPTLKLGADARTGAMGLAGVALPTTDDGGFWNPGALAALQGKTIRFSQQRWIQGVKTHFLSYGNGLNMRGFGGYFMFTEIGNIEYRIAPSAQPLEIFSAHELVIGFSYATMIANRFSIGITMKALYEKIYIDDAWGIVGDLGVQWKISSNGIRLGAALQNIGWTDKLQAERIPLPWTGRLGIYVPFSVFRGDWCLIADLVKIQEFPVHLHAGCEYGWHERIFFRMGYQTGYATRGLTAGIGLAWGIYAADYSYMPLQSGLGDSHRISFGFNFK